MAMTGYGSPIQHHEPEERRCQDVLMLVMSVWVVITPWFNGDLSVPLSQLNAQATGGLLFILTLWALARQHNPLPEYLNALLGAWLIATPFWAQGVPIERVQLWVIGSLVLIFGLWSARLARRTDHSPPRIQ
jgi:hypothetical protein